MRYCVYGHQERLGPRWADAVEPEYGSDVIDADGNPVAWVIGLDTVTGWCLCVDTHEGELVRAEEELQTVWVKRPAPLRLVPRRGPAQNPGP